MSPWVPHQPERRLTSEPDPSVADQADAVDHVAGVVAADAECNDQRAAKLTPGEGRRRAERDAATGHVVAGALFGLAAAIRRRRPVERDKRCVICKRSPADGAESSRADDGSAGSGRAEHGKRALCEVHRDELSRAVGALDGWQLDAARTLDELRAELEHSYCSAAFKKKRDKRSARLIRVGTAVRSGLAPLVAGVSGVLLGKGGGALHWPGVAAAVLGFAGSLALAGMPARQYSRQRAKSRRYERLVWEVRSYVLFGLADASRTDFCKRLDVWLALREEAGS